MLTNRDDSSLVVDKLCDQMGGQHTAVTCFYFDFAARKEQTATRMLGSVLKQVISGTERVPEDIWLVLQKQKKAVSGRKPSVPKRPVRPSFPQDGTDAVFSALALDGRRTVVRPNLCPGRTAGPYSLFE